MLILLLLFCDLRGNVTEPFGPIFMVVQRLPQAAVQPIGIFLTLKHTLCLVGVFHLHANEEVGYSSRYLVIIESDVAWRTDIRE